MVVQQITDGLSNLVNSSFLGSKRVLLTSLLALGITLPSFADDATMSGLFRLTSGSRPDLAIVTLENDFGTFTTTTNGLGQYTLDFIADGSTSIAPSPQVAPMRIITGENPSSYNVVHVSTPTIINRHGNLTGQVFGLDGSTVANLVNVGFSNNIGSYAPDTDLANGTYIAQIDGQAIPFTHLSGVGSPNYSLTTKMVERLDAISKQSETVANKGQRIDEIYDTICHLTVMPGENTQNHFNTWDTTLVINSEFTEFNYRFLEPLTSQLITGHALSLESLGVGGELSDLEGVLVQYFDEVGTLRGETLTDEFGNYSLDAEFTFNYEIDGVIRYTMDGYMPSEWDIFTSYSPEPYEFPRDVTSYQSPHEDPHTVLMVKDQYWDDISSQYVDFNWDYFTDMWLIGSVRPDGLIPAMMFRDGIDGNETLSKYPVYLDDSVSQWTRDNYIVPALGALNDSDPMNPLSLQGIFGNFLGEVLTARVGMNAEDILAYNGFNTDYENSEGAIVRIEDQNQSFIAFNSITGHIIGTTIEYSNFSPAIHVVQKEILRGMGPDIGGVTLYSPSIMLQNTQTAVGDVGNFIDRLNIGIKLAVGATTYGRGMVTPGTLYSIQRGLNPDN